MNEWVINPTADAVNQILVIDRTNKNGTLRIVGTVTTEKVIVMQPAVVVGVGGVTALDPANAAHWTATKYKVGGTSYAAELDVDNTAMAFPFTGTWLIKKEAGAAANEFGVEYA